MGAALVFSSSHCIRRAALEAVYAQGTNGGANTKNVTNPLAFTLVFQGTWV